MEFKNKKCDNVFHASLCLFAMALVFAVAMLFVAPVVSTWLALFALAPLSCMVGAGIVERKLSGVPFFQIREKKPEPAISEEDMEEEQDQEQEEEREEEIEEEIEEEQEAAPEMEEKPEEKVHEMGALSTPVEEKKVEPVIKEVVEAKKPKATKKTR